MFEFLIAFGAGLISFLSPCVLPLIPGYVSYISGQSLQEILESKKTNFFPLVLFCLGFSTVFVLLGASASFLGQALLQNSEFLRIVAGIIIVIFSFQLLGIINIPYLNFEKRPMIGCSFTRNLPETVHGVFNARTTHSGYRKFDDFFKLQCLIYSVK